MTYRCYAGSSIRRLYTKPEHGQDASAENCKIAEPVPEARTRCDRERHMQVRSDSAIEYSRQGIAYSCHERDEDSVGCRQTCISQRVPICRSWAYRKEIPEANIADPELQVEIVTKSENQ